MNWLAGCLLVGVVTLPVSAVATLVAGIFYAGGGVCSIAVRRFAPLEIRRGGRGVGWWEWLAVLHGWGGVFNAICGLAVAVAGVGTFQGWEFASTARTVAWWTVGLFGALYFLSGIGAGILRWHNGLIAEHLGLEESQLERLNRLTAEQQQAISERVDQLHEVYGEGPKGEGRAAVVAEVERMLTEYERAPSTQERPPDNRAGHS